MAEKAITSQRNMSQKEASDAKIGNHRVQHLIEQLRQRTAELEDANRELRRLSHYGSLFLARMSHELRTPLTSILGFSEILLEQEQLSETQRRFCQKIQDSGFQLQTSLNQLVDLSRLEAGQMEVFLQELSLREVLRESCATVARFAQKQQVKLTYELNSEATTIVSDQGKLRQILYNFLGWAVSRSDADSVVTMNAELNGSLLRIRIDDQGECIGDLDSVFDPKDTAGSLEPNVDELGIIIGRRLLEVLNGSVKLENRGPRGLRTIIEVPAAPTRG